MTALHTFIPLYVTVAARWLLLQPFLLNGIAPHLAHHTCPSPLYLGDNGITRSEERQCLLVRRRSEQVQTVVLADRFQPEKETGIMYSALECIRHHDEPRRNTRPENKYQQASLPLAPFSSKSKQYRISNASLAL